MSEYDEISTKLFEDAARHLSRRAARVRFKPCVSATAVGEAYNYFGDAIIDIDDRKLQHDPGRILSIFLHEVAHIADFKNVPSSDRATWAPGSDKDTQRHPLVNSRLYVERERTADELAAKWLAYANENYMRYGDKSMQRIERKLLCLADWQPTTPEIKNFIDETVKECISKGFSEAHTRQYVALAVNKQFGNGTKALGNSLKIIEK